LPRTGAGSGDDARTTRTDAAHVERSLFRAPSAHERAGRKAEARAIYADILAAIPDHPGALLKTAEHDIDARSLDAARARLDAALASAQRAAPPRRGHLVRLCAPRAAER
jgi:Tfp pilus assembly protein PilF